MKNVSETILAFPWMPCILHVQPEIKMAAAAELATVLQVPILGQAHKLCSGVKPVR